MRGFYTAGVLLLVLVSVSGDRGSEVELSKADRREEKGSSVNLLEVYAILEERTLDPQLHLETLPKPSCLCLRLTGLLIFHIPHFR